jgi:hypothetical protein
MTLVCITIADGDEHVVTLLEMSRRLDNPASCPDVLTALVQTGRADVELRGGLRAVVSYANTYTAAIIQLGFPLLLAGPREPDQPLRHYTADVRLLYEIPAHVQCRATSRNSAMSMIDQVLKHEAKAPLDFVVEIAQEEIEDVFNAISYGEHRPHLLGVHDHHIVDIRERLLIGTST